MVIKTERLSLRVASDEEMRGFIAAQSDEEMIKAYNEMLDGCVGHPEERVWYAIWMIELHDGTHAGDMCFKGLNPDGMVEIGYGIEPEYRGRGLATEAAGAAVRWAASQPGVMRVEAETEPENRESQRVLEKIGFVPNGITGAEGPRFVFKQ